MPVPEAAMNEDDLQPGGKHQVRATWEILAIHLKSVSQHVRQVLHHELGDSALGPNQAHALATLAR